MTTPVLEHAILTHRIQQARKAARARVGRIQQIPNRAPGVVAAANRRFLFPLDAAEEVHLPADQTHLVRLILDRVEGELATELADL